MLSNDQHDLTRFAHAWVAAFASLPGWHQPPPVRPNLDEADLFANPTNEEVLADPWLAAAWLVERTQPQPLRQPWPTERIIAPRERVLAAPSCVSDGSAAGPRVGRIAVPLLKCFDEHLIWPVLAQSAGQAARVDWAIKVAVKARLAGEADPSAQGSRPW